METDNKKKFYIKKYWKTIIFSLIILILCILPQNDIPESRINIPHFDKILHFGVYFILAIIFSFELQKLYSIFSKILIILIYSFILGAAIEIIQNYLIETRSGDWFDLIADIVGSIVGIGVFILLHKLRKFSSFIP